MKEKPALSFGADPLPLKPDIDMAYPNDVTLIQ